MRHQSWLILLSLAAFALLPWMASAQTSVSGLGVAIPIGQPGNLRYGSTVAMTVLLEKVDSPVVAVQWNNRVDLATGNVGYSTGNGGAISVRLRKVTSISNGKLRLGDIIGETDRVVDPVLRSSWNRHWQREGGTGTASERFRNYPTLRFRSPVDLEAAGLAVGDSLAFEFVQHNSRSGTVSINVAHADPWGFGTLRAFSDVFAQFRVFRSNGNESINKVAMVLFGYQDGVIKGNPWYGLSGSSHGNQFDVSGQNRIRQVIPINVIGNRIEKIHTMALRTTVNTAHDLIIELREAGSNPGGSSDEGRLLYKGTIFASSITQGTDLKHHEGVIEALSVTPPQPIQLTSGRTYYLVARSTGASTTYRMQKMHRGLNQAEFGLKKPDFLYSGFRGQQNTGSGWADIVGGTGSGPRNDVPLWMEFETTTGPETY